MTAVTNLEYHLGAGSSERSGTALLVAWLYISDIRNANQEHGSG